MITWNEVELEYDVFYFEQDSFDNLKLTIQSSEPIEQLHLGSRGHVSIKNSAEFFAVVNSYFGFDGFHEYTLTELPTIEEVL